MFQRRSQESELRAADGYEPNMTGAPVGLGSEDVGCSQIEIFIIIYTLTDLKIVKSFCRQRVRQMADFHFLGLPIFLW